MNSVQNPVFRFRVVAAPMVIVMNRAPVLELFARQHWVASVAQLASIGVSRSAVQRAHSAGLVVRPHRSVVAVAGVELSFDGRALALQLAAGDGSRAFISGPTAGVLHGLRAMPRGRLEMTIMEDHFHTTPAPHRLVRTAWLDETRDVTVRADGLRIASPLRMLFGLAEQFNQHRFERAAEDAWHLGLLTPDSAARYLAEIRRSGRSGVRRMETWLDKSTLRRRPAQSGLELDFVDMIMSVGLPPPVRQHPLRLPSGEVIHLDLAWPAARLAIEPGHTWWHGGDERMRHDQARDRACAVVGWHVARYDEHARRDPRGTALELLAIYRRRVADLSRFDAS